MLNDVMLFAPEGDNASWCGYANRTCVTCTFDVVGTDNFSKCSTRMMSLTMAAKIDRLADWVTTEWPLREFILIQIQF